ncbi:hypothetical protein DFH06DRAFT_1143528 [Mycena polygramma]|nr:hypothetical protein DFH06DRAFT_1143528 [Mycena polygramma]
MGFLFKIIIQLSAYLLSSLSTLHLVQSTVTAPLCTSSILRDSAICHSLNWHWCSITPLISGTNWCQKLEQTNTESGLHNDETLTLVVITVHEMLSALNDLDLLPGLNKHPRLRDEVKLSRKQGLACKNQTQAYAGLLSGALNTMEPRGWFSPNQAVAQRAFSRTLDVYQLFIDALLHSGNKTLECMETLDDHIHAANSRIADIRAATDQQINRLRGVWYFGGNRSHMADAEARLKVLTAAQTRTNAIHRMIWDLQAHLNELLTHTQVLYTFGSSPNVTGDSSPEAIQGLLDGSRNDKSDTLAGDKSLEKHWSRYPTQMGRQAGSYVDAISVLTLSLFLIPRTRRIMKTTVDTSSKTLRNYPRPLNTMANMRRNAYAYAEQAHRTEGAEYAFPICTRPWRITVSCSGQRARYNSGLSTWRLASKGRMPLGFMCRARGRGRELGGSESAVDQRANSRGRSGSDIEEQQGVAKDVGGSAPPGLCARGQWSGGVPVHAVDVAHEHVLLKEPPTVKRYRALNPDSFDTVVGHERERYKLDAVSRFSAIPRKTWTQRWQVSCFPEVVFKDLEQIEPLRDRSWEEAAGRRWSPPPRPFAKKVPEFVEQAVLAVWKEPTVQRAHDEREQLVLSRALTVCEELPGLDLDGERLVLSSTTLSSSKRHRLRRGAGARP